MNMVLIIFDSLRKDCLSCYGESPFWGKVYTRYLDEFSKELLIMTRVFPGSLPTLQVRRAIHTANRVFPFISANFRLCGNFVGAFGWEPIPESQETMLEILQEERYRTCLISSVYYQLNLWRGFNQWKFIRGKEKTPYRSGHLPSHEMIDYYLSKELQDEARIMLLKQVTMNSYDWKYEEDYPVAQVFIERAKWLEENSDILIQHTDIGALVLHFAGAKPKQPVEGKNFWENALEGKRVRDQVRYTWSPSIT
ncbi:sulfatase-like hydrolase/transferase, partial [bacterium]|nr:sulfatase-like hydrolase/transferase [bacterium]